MKFSEALMATVFIHKIVDHTNILAVYVDDIITIGNDEQYVNVQKDIASAFEIMDLKLFH